MTIESNFWTTVRDNLSPFGMLVRIESSAGNGVADVAYALRGPKTGSTPASGFLELKVADAFPARGSTPIRLRHLTKDQVLFAEEWSAAGGRAWLLLRIPPWTLLFDPPGIRQLYQGAVLAMDALAVAKAAGSGQFPTGKVLRCLTQ